MNKSTQSKPKPQHSSYFDEDPTIQRLQNPDTGRILEINRKEKGFIDALIANGYRKVTTQR